MADIDIESEKYRWMGSARLDFYVCPEIFSHFLSFYDFNCVNDYMEFSSVIMYNV